MPTQTVDLSEQQAEFIRAHVADGRFQDASEVVRAGLRLLEESEAAIRFRAERFKKLAEDGFDAIDRGEFEVVTESSLDGFMQSVSAVNRREVAKTRVGASSFRGFGPLALREITAGKIVAALRADCDWAIRLTRS